MTIVRGQIKELISRLLEPRRTIQVVAGPRQIGKTTIVKQLLSENYGALVEEDEKEDSPVVVTGSTTVSIPISGEDTENILPTIGQALHSLFHEMISRQQTKPEKQTKKTEYQNRLFCFSDMSSLIDAAAVLSKYENTHNYSHIYSPSEPKVLLCQKNAYVLFLFVS